MSTGLTSKRTEGSGIGALDGRLLQAYFQRLGDRCQNVYGCQVHLSKLPHVVRRPALVRVAARPLRRIAESRAATLFFLPDGDLLLLCESVPETEAETAVRFAIEPFLALSTGTTADPSDDQDLVSWFDLSHSDDAEELRALSKSLASALGESNALNSAFRRTLDLALLSEITALVRQEASTRFIERQLALDLSAKGGGIVFHENYVSLKRLAKCFSDPIDLFSPPSLFRYLTEILDQYMLEQVTDEKLAPTETANSINVNLSSLKTPLFQTFVNRGAGRGKVFLEFQVPEILSQPHVYHAAKDDLRQKGVGIVADGITPQMVEFIDVASIDADFIKIFWCDNLVDPRNAERSKTIDGHLNRVGSHRIILARVETEEAVKWGLRRGITRFQGQFVDRVIDDMRSSGIV